MGSRAIWRLVLLIIGVALLLPILAVLVAATQANPDSTDTVWQMAMTVLPDYVITSLLLCVLVAAGVLVLGLGAATLVTLVPAASIPALLSVGPLVTPMLPATLTLSARS